jgi:hypothetical protein
MKKIVFYLISVLLIISLFTGTVLFYCNVLSFKNISPELDNISMITVHNNLIGTEFEIADPNIITNTTEMLNKMGFSLGIGIIPTGSAYSIRFYDANHTLIYDICIIDENLVQVHDFIYFADTSSIISYLSSLENT